MLGMVVLWDKKNWGHLQEALKCHIFAMATELLLQ